MTEEHENTVELMGYYGGDTTHALSAWTSTSRELTDEKRARIGKLLADLAKDKHGTPFEKSAIHFLVKCDIVTHYQLLKHRIGVSINSESARYKELKDDRCFYVPTDWDDEEQARYEIFMESALKKYHETLARLKQKGYSTKRAKETARYYLPLGKQLKLDILYNFRSFMHMVGLRKPDSAQLEIRRLTDKKLELVRGTGAFRESLRAFGYE